MVKYARKKNCNNFALSLIGPKFGYLSVTCFVCWSTNLKKQMFHGTYCRIPRTRDLVYPFGYCICIFIYTYYYKLIFFTVTVIRQHSCCKSFNRCRHLVVNLYFQYIIIHLHHLESITFSFILFVYQFTRPYYFRPRFFLYRISCVTVYDKIMTT